MDRGRETDKPQFRPVVLDVVHGMEHPHTNIAAVHFDGPVLVNLLDALRHNPALGMPGASDRPHR